MTYCDDEISGARSGLHGSRPQQRGVGFTVGPSMSQRCGYGLREDIFRLSFANSVEVRLCNPKGCEKVAGGLSEAKTTG